MSRFAGLGDAKIFESGTYFEVGEHKIEVEKVLFKKTRKSGDAIIVECKVHASNVPDAIGARRTWMQTLRDTDIGFSNLLAFLLACSGAKSGTPEEKAVRTNAETILSEACDNGALNGTFLHASCVPHTTQKGDVITRVRFEPWDGPVDDGLSEAAK